MKNKFNGLVRQIKTNLSLKEMEKDSVKKSLEKNARRDIFLNSERKQINKEIKSLEKTLKMYKNYQILKVLNPIMSIVILGFYLYTLMNLASFIALGFIGASLVKTVLFTSLGIMGITSLSYLFGKIQGSLFKSLLNHRDVYKNYPDMEGISNIISMKYEKKKSLELEKALLDENKNILNNRLDFINRDICNLNERLDLANRKFSNVSSFNDGTLKKDSNQTFSTSRMDNSNEPIKEVVLSYRNGFVLKPRNNYQRTR